MTKIAAPLSTAIALLLLLGGSVGGFLWWRGHSGSSVTDNGVTVPPSTVSPGPVCSDDHDPKYLEQLKFEKPIIIPFGRKHLDALKDKPIPTIERYSWQPKELVAVLGEHRMRGHVFAASPDGKLLAIGSNNAGFLRIGETETVHEKAIVPCPGGAWAMAWSPKGDLLAVSCGDGLVRLYEVKNLAKIPEPQLLDKAAGLVTCLSFSGDGKYLLGGDNTPALGAAWVWEVESHKVVKKLQHSGPVRGVAFSPVPGEYRALTAGGTEDETLRLWEPFSGKEPVKIDFSEKPLKFDLGEVAISPDGKRALSAHVNHNNLQAWSVRLWDLDKFQKGAEVAVLDNHFGPPSVAFSVDGKYFATARLNDSGVWLWDADKGKQVRQIVVSAGVFAIRFLDKERLAFAGTNGYDQNIHIHEIESRKEWRPPLGHLAAATGVALSPDGRRVVSCGAENMARRWDLMTVEEQLPAVVGGLQGGVGFHPDARHFYCYSPYQGTLPFFNIETGASRPLTYDHAHNGGLCSAVITRDGYYALTGGFHDGTVRMWDLRDGRQVRLFDLGPDQGAPILAVSPDMVRALRTGGGKTRLLHLRCQEVKHEWPAIPVTVFRPDAQAVFFGEPNRSTAAVWQVKGEKAKQTDEIKLNLNGIVAGQLSSDGQRLAALGGGKAAVYDLTSPRLIWEWTPPPHFGGVYGVALSSDGQDLLTANGDGTVYVIRLP